MYCLVGMSAEQNAATDTARVAKISSEDGINKFDVILTVHRR